MVYTILVQRDKSCNIRLIIINSHSASFLYTGYIHCKSNIAVYFHAALTQLHPKGIECYHDLIFFSHFSCKQEVFDWGEPERAPHSRDLHHFFVSYTRLTSVHPIAYNRISTWKTGILRARAGRICAAPPARALDPAGLRANCASGLDTPCSVHERCPSIYAG